MLSLGLNGLRGSSSSPTFSGAVSALEFNVTGTSAGEGINFASGINRLDWGGGLWVDGGAGVRCSSQFSSISANGVVAFLISTAGARLKFSSGGTTDYMYSDGSQTITAAGSFVATGGVGPVSSALFSNGSSVPACGINANPNSLYIGGAGGLILGSGLGSTATAGEIHLNASSRVVVTGDTTSPARAAFSLTPQDAQPTGASVVGDMYVTTAGVLKVCTAAGTPGTWVSVGAQV